ncbi:zinc finger protein [Trypanosoma melophagium]|uniref:zinc finger protein n=1 Tax=Trypanosoma melophagium TaxID=715481 RepID=UPI00351A308E|nr:zinc finger protein [Trypanosoma melophagium]
MKRYVSSRPAVIARVIRGSNLSNGSSFSLLAPCGENFMYIVPHRVSYIRFATQSPVLLQSWAQRVNRLWMCIKEDCRHVNASGASHCEKCNSEKPILKGWLCVDCETRNHKGVKKCHKCGASVDLSEDFWMCIACEKNNRIDELDDNSRCGFCGYDMAPMSMTEAEALRIQNERSQRIREAQEQFDNLSAKDSDEQFGDETAGASMLPDAIRGPLSATSNIHTSGTSVNTPHSSTSTLSSLPRNIPEVKPFTPTPLETAHSRLYRKSKRLPPAAMPQGPPGFDWMCRETNCGTINAGDEENCTKCGTHITPSEWECCHCGAVNHLSRSRCFNCQVAISVSWICSSCRAATSIYDCTCRACGVPRPPTEPKEARDVQQTWKANSTISGGGRRRTMRREDWNCAECQGLNFASRTACFQCGAPKSTSDEAISTAGAESVPDPALSHNNWFCRYCQASNFRTRTSCWQCGRASAESGATSWSNDASAPQFEREGFQQDVDGSVAEGQLNVWNKKSDDWTCGKCFSKNFKNRQECHKCGAAKTVAVAPRRAFVRKPVKI